MIEPYYKAIIRPGKKVSIPLIYAYDAVHGHNNVYGAALFPRYLCCWPFHPERLDQYLWQAVSIFDQLAMQRPTA
jgi:hypothetical protein